MAEINTTIDTDGLDDYLSMNAWNTAEATNLVSDDDTHIATARASSDSADTTGVVASGWTTDSTRFPTVTVTTANRHDGTRGTGYRLAPSSGNTVLEPQANFFVFFGIAFDGDGVSFSAIYFAAFDNITMDSCLVYDGSAKGIESGSNSDNHKIVNCIVYGSSTTGIDIINNQNTYIGRKAGEDDEGGDLLSPPRNNRQFPGS